MHFPITEDFFNLDYIPHLEELSGYTTPSDIRRENWGDRAGNKEETS